MTGRARLAALILVGAVVGAVPAPAARRETDVARPYQRARLAARTAEAETTPRLRAIARRPAVAAAFARYRAEGGLLPRLRFAEARDRGLAVGRPLAFDLACAVPARAGFAVRDLDVAPHPIGASLPLPGTTVRLSVDRAAGLWREERGLVDDAPRAPGGLLAVPARAGPGETASGRLLIDGDAGTIDDTRRVAETATGRVRVNALRLACARAPFSGLFGLAAPARSAGR